jgi:hypothetical protein
MECRASGRSSDDNLEGELDCVQAPLDHLLTDRKRGDG